MADKKKTEVQQEKPKGILGELDVKIKNNRKRYSDLNAKIDNEFKVLARDAHVAPKNTKRIKYLENEVEKFKKQEHKDRRRIMKAEAKLKSNTNDLNVVKTMQLKDFEMVKAKINKQSDFMTKEALRLNDVIDSLKTGVASKNLVSKTTVSSNISSNKSVSGTIRTGSLSNEEKALKLVSLYFQEIARTGFKKSLTLSEMINAYQYVLGRFEGIEASEKPAKETIIREEKVSKEAENLMENIDKLKESIDASALTKLPERKIEGYAHTNSRGTTYYLHNRGKLYFFSKDPMNAVDKPENRTVIENKMTGLPILKKKK